MYDRKNIVAPYLNRRLFRRAFLLVFVLFVMAIIIFDSRDATAHDPIVDVQQTVGVLGTQISDLQAKIDKLEAGGAIDISVINALRVDLDKLEADIAGISLIGAEELQAQITAQDAAIKALQLRPASVDRTTAVPPLRLHGLPHGTLIEHRPIFKQVNLIDVEFRISHFPDPPAAMGLISRDENGCNAAGHFSLFIAKDRRLALRTQAQGCQPKVNIKSNQQLEAGGTHRVQVVNGPTKTVMFLDGVEVASSDTVNAWGGNTLPLVFGATCWGLKEDVCIAEPQKRAGKFIGALSADIYAARQVFMVQ